MARILVIGSAAESLTRLRKHLLQKMVQQGHEVIASAPGEAVDVSRQLKEIGVEYRPVSLARAGLNPVADVYGLYCLWRLFRSVSPDVYFGYAIKPVMYGSIVARSAGVRRIYSMIPGAGYVFSGDGFRSRLVRALVSGLYRFAFRFNRKVFFQNPDDRRLFSDLRLLDVEEKAVLINGSGVDIEYFSPRPYPNKVSFLLVARLLGVKGIAEYAAAARDIVKKNPDSVCRLVGFFENSPSGLSRTEIQKWVDEGAIEFLGPLQDVRPAIAKSSVFVLPSYYREGTPRSILEAMAMARAIITTDSPGCRETVENGVNGFLVPARNSEALRQAMQEFIDNPESIRTMGAESRRIAIEKYDVRDVTSSILNAMDLN